MNNTQEVLTEAYHAIFDIKDGLQQGTDAFYLAYEVLHKIDALMRVLGLDLPIRFDGQGRQS